MESTQTPRPQDPERKHWYAVITAAVLYDQDLTDKHKILMAVISNLAGKEGYCFASNAYLADLVNCTERTVQRNLVDLESMGYIGRVMQPGSAPGSIVRALTPIAGPKKTPGGGDTGVRGGRHRRQGGGDTGVRGGATPASCIITKDNNKPYKPRKSALPIFGKMKDAFISRYPKTAGEYYWTAKDAKHLSDLIKKIEFKVKEKICAKKESDKITDAIDNGKWAMMDEEARAVVIEELMLGSFSLIMDYALSGKDAFLVKNFNPAILNSKFNDIYMNLKKGASSKFHLDQDQDYSRKL